jgi:hypothetical protein
MTDFPAFERTGSLLAITPARRLSIRQSDCSRRKQRHRQIRRRRYANRLSQI